MLGYRTNAVPSNGTNEVQTIAIGATPTSGTFNLAQFGVDSGAITWSATTGTMVANTQAGMDLIFGAGNTVVANSTLSSGVGNMTVTFQKYRGAMNQAGALTVSANNLVGAGATVAVTVTTPGVWATNRGAAIGDELVFAGGSCNSAIQTLTFAGSGLGGTYTITGQSPQYGALPLTTAAITWSGTNSTDVTNMQNALNTTFGTNNVVVSTGTASSGIGTFILTMSGTMAFANVPLFTANGANLTGTTPSVSIASTTTGGVSGGTCPAIPYVNISTTPSNPNWVPKGVGLTLAMGSPALGSGLSILAGHADTGSNQVFTTFAHQPDVPRCIVATPSGTTGNVTAVSDIVVGLDVNGNVITETLPAYTAGQATAVTSVNAFASLLSYTQVANGASVTITVTASPKIGLGIPVSLTGRVDAWLAGTLEVTKPTITVGGNTIAKNLVQLSSSLTSASAVIVAVTPS